MIQLEAWRGHGVDSESLAPWLEDQTEMIYCKRPSGWESNSMQTTLTFRKSRQLRGRDSIRLGMI
jgi:hypothetical protein